VNIAFQDANGEMTGRIPTAVTVPYAYEYASTTHNASLLNQLASQTGGRVLSFDDMEFVDLFDDATIKQPVSPQSVWDLLAIIAASMLVLDVAIRRLWIDKKGMQSMLSPVSKVSTSSVEALRRVHKPVKQTRQTTEEDDQIPVEKVKHKKVQKDSIQNAENRDDNLGQLLKKKRERDNPEDNE
jgi:hypothetical protein